MTHCGTRRCLTARRAASFKGSGGAPGKAGGDCDGCGNASHRQRGTGVRRRGPGMVGGAPGRGREGKCPVPPPGATRQTSGDRPSVGATGRSKPSRGMAPGQPATVRLAAHPPESVSTNAERCAPRAWGGPNGSVPFPVRLAGVEGVDGPSTLGRVGVLHTPASPRPGTPTRWHSARPRRATGGR